MWARLKQSIDTLLVIPIIATFYIIDSKIISIRSTSGQSMQPTINQFSILVVDKFFYKFRNPSLQKGDIVLAKQPINPSTNICKRIIETGGNYLPSHPDLKVPEGNVWLEGDNKIASYDSRHHGCVPIHLIEGRVMYIFSL